MVTERVRGVIAPRLADVGLLVEEVTVTPAGRRRVLRVAVDRDLDAVDLGGDDTPVAPLDLDEVAEATRVVDAALEASDVMGTAPYVLEVSSPGVDRPLTERRHLRRNVGRMVDVSTVDEGGVVGRIRAVSADELVLETPTGALRMPVSHVRSARVQVEFARAGQEEPA